MFNGATAVGELQQSVEIHLQCEPNIGRYVLFVIGEIVIHPTCSVTTNTVEVTPVTPTATVATDATCNGVA
jgi:hypothetical protein